MSVYNYTALKSSPLKACIPTECGLTLEVNLYKIKWHGKDYSLDSWDKRPFQQIGDHYSFDMISRRAEQSWKGEEPQYLVSSGPLDTGKIDWNDPDVQENGLRVYRTNATSWQESQICEDYIGDLFRIGRGKYEFRPKVLKQESRQSL